MFSSFGLKPRSSLLLKWRNFNIKRSLSHFIILEKTGVDRSCSVSQYIFKFGFPTIPVTSSRSRNFLISFVVTGTHWPMSYQLFQEIPPWNSLHIYLFLLQLPQQLPLLGKVQKILLVEGCLLFSPWALCSQQKQIFPDLHGPQYLCFPISNHQPHHYHFLVWHCPGQYVLVCHHIHTYSIAPNTLTCSCKTTYPSSSTSVDSFYVCTC